MRTSQIAKHQNKYVQTPTSRRLSDEVMVAASWHERAILANLEKTGPKRIRLTRALFKCLLVRITFSSARYMADRFSAEKGNAASRACRRMPIRNGLNS